MKIVDENNIETKQISDPEGKKLIKILNEYGNEIGYKRASDTEYVIKDNYNDMLGYIDGANCIFDKYGDKLGEIRDSGVWDKYGDRIGDIKGDVLISLFASAAPQPIYNDDYTPPTITSSNDSECLGILGWLILIIGEVFTFCLHSLGGKIGLGTGAVLGVIISIGNKNLGQGIVFTFLGALIIGIAGLIIEGIVRLIILIIKGIIRIIELIKNKKETGQ